MSMYPVTRIDDLQYLLLLSWSHSESLPPMIDKLYTTDPTRATREGCHDDNYDDKFGEKHTFPISSCHL